MLAGLVFVVLGFASAAAPFAPSVAAQAMRTATDSDTFNELALAAAIVDALNQGDEDGVVALFDPEATLRADR